MNNISRTNWEALASMSEDYLQLGKMTELLQRVIAQLEKLPEEEQDAIATRLLAELEDERAWKVRFESTTNEQWDKLAQMVRQEIAAGDITPLDQVFPHLDLSNRTVDGLPSYYGGD